MQQLAIRCHPLAPVENDAVDEWLRAEVERLRERSPHAVMRLMRMTQTLPSGDADVGWLLELDGAGGEPPLDDDGLAQIVRDLRLLGLHPMVLEGNGSPC